MDADAVQANTDRAGGVAQVPPGGVDASLLVVVLLDVVPVHDVGVTHAGKHPCSERAPERLVDNSRTRSRTNPMEAAGIEPASEVAP